jgi:hypothetical protein
MREFIFQSHVKCWIKTTHMYLAYFKLSLFKKVAMEEMNFKEPWRRREDRVTLQL